MTAVAPTGFDQLAFARRILRSEAATLHVVAGRLDESFPDAVDVLFRCAGRVAVSGVGKSADVGQKLVGTLNSTGTRAYTLDATRALHGDLGMVHPDDVALLLSHSGESEELVKLLGPLKKQASAVVLLTGNGQSTLARGANAVVAYGPITEACPMSLAPSTSTTVMIAIGDALAFTLSELRQFTADDFARYHPAGSLGRKLATVESYMRTGDDLRIAPSTDTVRAVFAKARHGGRRTGAVMLVRPDGTLAGLFTDSDLARLFENREDTAFDRPVAEVMTADPTTAVGSTRIADAIAVMRARKFSELPVVDADGRPIGMLDITDILGLDPDATNSNLRPVLRVLGPEVV